MAPGGCKLVLGPHAAAVVAVAKICKFDLEVSTQNPEGASNERPFVAFSDFTISGVLSICRYIGAISGDVSIAGDEATSWAEWAISSLSPILQGVNKNEICRYMQSLDATCKGREYLVGNTLSLADLVVLSSFLDSRFRSLSEFPHLQAWVSRIESHKSVISALNRISFEKVQTPTCLRENGNPETFYITTAINYTNGPPHIGHAYEGITTDVIARYNRRFGRDVFYMTGTDDHGQKIAQTAESRGMTPEQMTEEYANMFKNLNKALGVSQDFFIRTVMDCHQETCQWLWRKAKEAGDIYLGTYNGWYNVREETFVPEHEAALSDYKDPMSGLPLQKMEEESYFFRLSKYRERLLDHIQNQEPLFVQPEQFRKDILARLHESTEDLSISRSKFSWGIPVPDDPKHVMYVWFDALTNYISGANLPNGERSRYWPANVQVVGKDLIRFHCIIWPAMLMSTGIPLPKRVFSHGFIHAADGKKMSKSLGNVIDPWDMVNAHGSDALRWYMARVAKYGADLKFDERALVDMYNSELADSLGNLVHRVTGLCQKFCDGVIPNVPAMAGPPPFDIGKLRFQVENHFQLFQIEEASEATISAVRDINKYLTDKAPWSMKDLQSKQQVVKIVLEAIYAIAHFLEPYVPTAASQMFEKLGTPPKTICELSEWFDNLQVGTPITIGEVLFVKKQLAAKEAAT